MSALDQFLRLPAPVREGIVEHMGRFAIATLSCARISPRVRLVAQREEFEQTVRAAAERERALA